MNTSVETWRQDAENPDLWHGAYGVIVNGAALIERETFYTVIRLPRPQAPKEALKRQRVRL
jgi:hypothetical protein